MNDQKDRRIRILLSILFFPIGLILALAGVQTRIIAWCFAGFYVWILTVIIIIGAIGGETDVAQGEPVEAAPIPILESTDTPIPTPIVQNCPSIQEQAYFNAVAENLTERREYLQTIERLSGQVSGDLSLMFDNTWKLEMGITLGLLTASAQEIDSMVPPASTLDIHQTLLHIGGYQRNAAMLYAEGLDAFDSNKIVVANAYLTDASEYYPLINQQLDSFCEVDQSSSIQQSPVSEVVQVSNLPSDPVAKPTSPPRLTPIPTPTPTPTTMPSPTPDVPLMSKEDCQQVTDAYMEGIIEPAILDGADDPMTFRYWTEGFSDSMPLGYTLQYQEYSGFGDKPEHHRVIGHVLVHWKDNNVQEYMVEFFPHPTTCLPRKDAIYTGWGVEPWFEYEDVEFVVLNLTDAVNNLEYHLRGVEEPTGIVEIGD